MKKAVTFIVVFVAALAAFFAAIFWTDYSNTHSSQWHEVGNSEMSITIPKSMKEGQGFTVTTGQTSVGVYENSKASVSVSKIPFSTDENLKSLDIEKYINSITMDGNKLVAKPINDGYYATYTQRGGAKDGEPSQIYSIEAFFIGDDAFYSVKVSCLIDKKDDYEESMMEWIKSFELK